MNFLFSRFAVRPLRSLSGGVLSAALLGLCAVAHAQALQPPEIAAHSYLLLDLTSNQVLAGRG